MKKFTLLMITALMAVMSWAQTPHQLFKTGPKTPVQKAPAKWAKYHSKRAFDSSILLGGDPVTLIVKNYAYTQKNYGTEDEPDVQLEPATMERVTDSWTFTVTDAATSTNINATKRSK